MIPTWSTAKLAGTIAAGAIVAALLFTLVTSWMSRGQEIARLKDWQNGVVIAATDATVQPDAKGVRKTLLPVQVPSAIGALKRSLDNANVAFDSITRTAAESKLRAEEANAALANASVLFDKQYVSSQKRIDALANKKPQATPELQCQAVTADSKAAWEGWK